MKCLHLLLPLFENHAFEDIDAHKPEVIVLSTKSPLYRQSSVNEENKIVIPPPPPGKEPNFYQRMHQEGIEVRFGDTIVGDINNNNNVKLPVTSKIGGFLRKTFKSKKHKLL